jgi:PP-loop superfamily ATP-utilizing enzyme
MSAFIIGVVVPLIIESEIWEDKMEAKKIKQIHKAYLRIATEWGAFIIKRKKSRCNYCQRPYDNL